MFLLRSASTMSFGGDGPGDMQGVHNFLTSSSQAPTGKPIKDVLQRGFLTLAERRFQMAWCIQGDDATLVNDGHPAAKPVGFLHVVGGRGRR